MRSKSPGELMQAAQHRCRFGAPQCGTATTGKGGRRLRKRLTKPKLHANPARTDRGRKRSGGTGIRGVPRRRAPFCNPTHLPKRVGIALPPVATLRTCAARTGARARVAPHAGTHGDGVRASLVSGYLRSIRALRAHQRAIDHKSTFVQETFMSILPNLTLIGSKHILGVLGTT